ncbi:Ig-like domain-containing protein [Ramlibacter montanisoli]|nr:putative Ig domain-containing protein [Ramlibacter montanisoli]
MAAGDSDGDSLSYTVANLPAGARFDPTTGRLTWTPNLFAAGRYPGIVLSVSDGAATVSETIAITVAQNNQAPLLAGMPPLGGQERQLLQFTLVGTDPDGDALRYTPVGTLPEGAFFDGSNGRFEWLPSHAQAGDYTLNFTVSDASGAQDSMAVQVAIADVNRAPLLSFTNHLAELGQPLEFSVAASDEDLGETLVFSAQGLPEGATLDAATGQLRWTPGAGQAGDYLVIVGVSDGKSTVQRGLALRALTQPQGPQVAIVLTPSFPAVPGQPVAISVLADAISAVASRSLTINGMAVALDGQGRAIFTAPASGLFQLEATATDLDGFVGSTHLVLKVRDPADAAAPVVAFEPGLGGRTLETATVLNASIVDSNLESWTLEIARLGSERFSVLAHGQAAISGALASLAPSAFETGAYVLRLTATDVAGRSARTQVQVEIRAAGASSGYARSESDFSAALAGHALDFTRHYDSRAADRDGSFGSGWRLAWRDTDLSSDLPLGGAEERGLYPPLEQGTRVYLSAPSGERVGFTFAPQAVSRGGLSWFEAHWVADAGSGWQLESVPDKLLRAGDRYYLLDGTRPYNPAAATPDRAQYTLVSAAGTRYEINAARGVTGIVFADGVRLGVSDSGVVAANGDLIRFVADGQGRLSAVVAPDGRIFSYEYDDQGRLVSARNLSAAQSQRYAYGAQGVLALSAGSAGGVAVTYGGEATVMPIDADLGAALAYLNAGHSGSLAAGQTARLTFSVRESELQATAGGAVLLGVVVSATSGDLIPALPQIDGLSPLVSRVEGSEVFALYRVDSAGLKRLELAGSGSGDYALRLFVAGDLNGDQRVDGRDAQAMAIARAGAYSMAADVERDGDVDASDVQLLFANLGYAPNQAPSVASGAFKTHVDLAADRAIGNLVTDPEGDRLSLRITGTSQGSAQIVGDGRTVLFTPSAGFTGTGTVTVVADDGYSASTPTTLSFTVSDSPLLAIDFDRRDFKLRPGDQYAVRLIGTFADEADVALPADYLSFSSFDPAVAAVNARGSITALSEGSGGLLVTRGAISAAAAIGVGTPRTAAQVYTYYSGIDAYPDSLAMTAGAQRQMVVQWGTNDVSRAADGVRYVVGNSALLSITADGQLTALAEGTTTVTAIFESGEQVIPVTVLRPLTGPAVVGSAAVIVEGDGGQSVAFGAGQLSGPATVSVTTLAEADLEVVVPTVMDFAGAFRLDIQGATVNGPIQIAAPVAGAVAGETVYFLRQIESSLVDGTPQKYWAVLDTGIVGADGVARSTSPPWPGLSSNGNILIARANQPLRTVTLDLDAWMAASQILLVGAATGTLAGVAIAGTLATAVLVFPMIYQATLVRLYASYAEQTLTTVVPIDVGQTSTRLRVSVELPPSLPSLDPTLTGASFVAATASVTITGSDFLDVIDPSAGARVVFRQGGRDIVVTASAVSATSVTVTVPATVVLGLADIFIERGEKVVAMVGGSLGSNTTWVRSRNSVRVDNPGGYGFTGRFDGVSVIDVQFKGQPGTEQVIQNIAIVTPDPAAPPSPPNPPTPPIPRQVTGTLVTSDLSRAFAIVRQDRGRGLHAAVAVIDGVALRLSDADPTTSAVDMIELPFMYGPPDPTDPSGLANEPMLSAMALDPNGRYLYVGGGGAIYVIDIDPGSPTLHQRVQTIAAPTLTGKFNDMAVNAGGTRLYVTAPATELYGPTRELSWMTGTSGTHRTAGKVLVINVDEADRPVPTATNPTPLNARKWRQVIAELDGGVEPFGIKATSDPNRMMFTSRLRKIVDRAPDDNTIYGLSTIQVTSDDPLAYAADLKAIDLTVSPNPSFHYQLSIKNPADVVVLPDLSYAFVSDWYVPLSVGPTGGASMIEYEEKHETGAKIAIVKDPFGPSPKIVGATTPIPFGFANELELSSDNKKLYAVYKGTGDIVVFDIENLLQRSRVVPLVPNTATTDASGRRVEMLQRFPIDNLPQEQDPPIILTDVLVAVQDLPVNLPAIPVAAAIRGLAIQPNDPLTLISPIDTREVNAPGSTLTFKWSVDTSLLGSASYTSRVFLSALPPGLGLWPNDAPSSRTPILEAEAPDPLNIHGLPDNNPNRIYTSDFIPAGTNEFTLPFSPGVLTAGQRYYWGVELRSGGDKFSESASFIAKPQSSGTTYNGVTILTHGFQLDPTGGSDRFAQPEPFMQLARLIADASGGGVVLSYDKLTGQWVDVASGLKGLAALKPGKAVVLVSDWFGIRHQRCGLLRSRRRRALRVAEGPGQQGGWHAVRLQAALHRPQPRHRRQQRDRATPGYLRPGGGRRPHDDAGSPRLQAGCAEGAGRVLPEDDHDGDHAGPGRDRGGFRCSAAPGRRVADPANPQGEHQQGARPGQRAGDRTRYSVRRFQRSGRQALEQRRLPRQLLPDQRLRRNHGDRGRAGADRRGRLYRHAERDFDRRRQHRLVTQRRGRVHAGRLQGFGADSDPGPGRAAADQPWVRAGHRRPAQPRMAVVCRHGRHQPLPFRRCSLVPPRGRPGRDRADHRRLAVVPVQRAPVVLEHSGHGAQQQRQRHALDRPGFHLGRRDQRLVLQRGRRRRVAAPCCADTGTRAGARARDTASAHRPRRPGQHRQHRSHGRHRSGAFGLQRQFRERLAPVAVAPPGRRRQRTFPPVVRAARLVVPWWIGFPCERPAGRGHRRDRLVRLRNQPDDGRDERLREDL